MRRLKKKAGYYDFAKFYTTIFSSNHFQDNEISRDLVEEDGLFSFSISVNSLFSPGDFIDYSGLEIEEQKKNGDYSGAEELYNFLNGFSSYFESTNSLKKDLIAKVLDWYGEYIENKIRTKLNISPENVFLDGLGYGTYEPNKNYCWVKFGFKLQFSVDLSNIELTEEEERLKLRDLIEFADSIGDKEWKKELLNRLKEFRKNAKLKSKKFN